MMSAVEAAPPPPRPPRPTAPPSMGKSKAKNNFKSGFSLDLESIDFGECARLGNIKYEISSFVAEHPDFIEL